MSNLDAIPFEEQYDDDELKEDLSKLDTLQDEITQLEEMEAETKELYKAFNL